MASPALKRAINDIGRYFGIRAADAFLLSVIGPGDESIEDLLDPPQADSQNVIADIINSISGQGNATSVTALLEYISTVVKDDAAAANLLNDSMSITLDSPGYLTVDAANLPLNAPTVTTTAGADETQGMFKPEASKDFYTVADYVEEGWEQCPVHVIQVFPAIQNIANSDTDAAALFMNAVPTLDLSRAMPFMDVQVMVKDQDGFAPGNQTLRLSLGRHLLGSSLADEDTVSQSILTAPDVEGPMMGKDEAGKPEPYWTAATMEAFTTPQTMVPTNADGSLLRNQGHGPYDAPYDPFRPMLSLNSFSLNAINTQGMMSYKSADMELVLHDRTRLGSITPLVAPTELAEVALKITYGWAHPDGSDSYNGALALNRLSDADSNRFADLINSLRVTEDFAVQNSSFNFEEDGSVRISLKLSTKGAAAANKIDITLPLVADAFNDLRRLTDSIDEQLRAARKDRDKVGKLNVPTVVQRMTSARAVTSIKPEDIKELKKFNRDAKDGDLQAIGRTIEKLLKEAGSHKKTKRTAINNLMEHLKSTPDPFLRAVGDYGGPGKGECAIRKKTTSVPPPSPPPPRAPAAPPPQGSGDIGDPLAGERRRQAAAAQAAMDALASAAAPTKKTFWGWTSFAGARTAKALAYKGDGKSRFVSLGKLLSALVAGPMAHTSMYDEIQLVFYAFNDSAAALYDCNIAQFPIDCSDLKKRLEERFDASGTMSIAAFLQLISTYYLTDEGSQGYGFGKVYGGRKKGNARQRVFESNYVHSRGKNKGQPKLKQIQSKKEEVMRALYGMEAADPSCVFKPPQISCRFEAVPMREEYSGAFRKKTLLKIHVFDRKCSGAESLMSVLDSFSGHSVARMLTREPRSPRSTKHQAIYAEQFNVLSSPPLEIIKSVPPMTAEVAKTLGLKDKDLEKTLIAGCYSVSEGSTARIKEVFSSMFPAFIYGGLNSGIISAKLASLNNQPLTTLGIVGRGKTDPDASDVDDGLPMAIMPMSLTLETYGFPLFEIGQQYFLDMTTNTTADNFYAVTSVTHAIEAGRFVSTVEMSTMSSYAKWKPTTAWLQKLALAGAITANEGKSSS